jgi:predicted O-methyltransferase YrrM
MGLDAPQTQTTEAERTLLREFLTGRRVIVEIGVFEGFTTKYLADWAEKKSKVFGVDTFSPGRLGICWGELIAKRHNRSHIAASKLSLVNASSTMVGVLVPKQVDFVFIDGDHSLNGISSDWSFWTDRCLPGGIIALHDVLSTGKDQFGSHNYYKTVIQRDLRFATVASADSLAVLLKKY